MVYAGSVLGVKSSQVVLKILFNLSLRLSVEDDASLPPFPFTQNRLLLFGWSVPPPGSFPRQPQRPLGSSLKVTLIPKIAPIPALGRIPVVPFQDDGGHKAPGEPSQGNLGSLSPAHGGPNKGFPHSPLPPSGGFQWPNESLSGPNMVSMSTWMNPNHLVKIFSGKWWRFGHHCRLEVSSRCQGGIWISVSRP